MDESGSITAGDFAKDKTAIAQMASGLTFGPTRFGVGLVEFSGDARTGIDFSYVQATFLNGLNAVYQRGGSTNTYSGLVAAQQMLTSQGRAGATKIIITITDGDWNVNVNQTKPELDSLKAAGDLLFGVGVGANISTANINLLSSKPEYAFPVADYTALATTLSHIAADIISPAAKNLSYSAQTTPDFTVTGATASSGTASHTANTVSWTLDQLATETVTVTLSIAARRRDGRHRCRSTRRPNSLDGRRRVRRLQHDPGDRDRLRHLAADDHGRRRASRQRRGLEQWPGERDAQRHRPRRRGGRRLDELQPRWRCGADLHRPLRRLRRRFAPHYLLLR